MGRNNDFIFYHPDDPEYDGGPVAPGDNYVFVHDDDDKYDDKYDDEFYDDYVLNDDDSLPDYYVVTDDDIVVYNDGTASTFPGIRALYRAFRDEFNKHNDGYITAVHDEPPVPAKCHCGRYNPCRHHDHYDVYDNPDDDFIQYVNDYYRTDDEHLVNKHHNYD